MKKIIACILVVAMSCALFGCLPEMTAVEKFLLAVGKMDIAAMQKELVPDETTGSFYRKLQNADLSEEALEVLRKLYSAVQYTIGEVSSENAKEKTVSVTIRIPDMEKIRSLATARILVSGDSPEMVLMAMLAEGQISSNMSKEYSFSVKMTETDGSFKIPYGDKANADFVKALALAEMFDFMN